MKSYVAIYCIYNPDNYRGHFVLRFKATDMEAAELHVHKHLDSLMMHSRAPLEYQINETVEQGSYRLYDNKEHKRL